MHRLSQNSSPAARPRPENDYGRLALALVLGLTMAGLPIFFHLVGQPLALAICVANAVVVARLFPADIPVFVFASLIFQNLFVAFVSVNFAENKELEPLKSYNFVSTMIFWLIVAYQYVSDYGSFSPFVRRLILTSAGALAVIAVYFIAGLAINPRNAAVYLRNLGLPILMFQMFLVISSKYELALPSIASAFLGLLIVCGYLEFLTPRFWFSATNGVHYLTLGYAGFLTSPTTLKSASETGGVITDVMDFLKTDFLNSSLFSGLGLKVQRLLGPNLHPISFGYLLATFMSFAAVHRRWLLTALALPLLLQTSAKGPLVLALFTLAFCFVAARFRGSRTLAGLGVLLAAYIAFAIQSGKASGDYHVLGLLGGVNGFLRNPIGHTLAQGGNLSVTDFAAIDWSKFQNAGAADVALESAVGVVLFQLGLAAAALFAFYLSIAWKSWRAYQLLGAPALAYACGAICVILVNGALQEEAYFAPLALALVMAFVGLSLGAADRVITARLGLEARRAQAQAARARPLDISPATAQIRPRPY